MPDADSTTREPELRREIIAIVGPCASGKSTLAANLRAIGFDARVSGQEHSEIASLWKRLNADIVVALHIDLETLRARRGETWSASLFETQLKRLREAYTAADIHLNTAALDEAEAVANVLQVLRMDTRPDHSQ